MRRGLGIPDSVINELALRMLEGFAETEAQSGIEVKNRDAMVLAALLLAENPDISLRKIAAHIGVNVSTLSRCQRCHADVSVRIFAL